MCVDRSPSRTVKCHHRSRLILSCRCALCRNKCARMRLQPRQRRAEQVVRPGTPRRFTRSRARQASSIEEGDTGLQSGKVFDAVVEEEFSDSDIETAPTRRWSTLSAKRFSYLPGTVLGSAGLIAGLTIGAGILALPKTTQVRAAKDGVQHHHRVDTGHT